jgi:sec-independent protein translocase protein TatA
MLALWMPSGWELVVVLLVALLLFGRKMPEIAKAIGASFWNLKKGFEDGEE